MIEILLASIGILALDLAKLWNHKTRSWGWFAVRMTLLAVASYFTTTGLCLLVGAITIWEHILHLEREERGEDSFWFRQWMGPNKLSGSFDFWHVLSFLSTIPVQLEVIWRVTPLEWPYAFWWIAVALFAKFVLWRYLTPPRWRRR